MLLKMEDKDLIRRLINIQRLSQREVNRRFGWSRDFIVDANRILETKSFTYAAIDSGTLMVWGEVQ